MSISGLIDRLDDWINPIVVKELRQAVKSRLVTSVLLLFLGVQLVILGWFLAFRELNYGYRDMSFGGDPMNWSVGKEIFSVLQAILLGACMVLIPTYASLRMSGERSDTNVDLLFISTLRPTSIIAGKFFSALVLAMLVFSCCAPFMTFTYLLRGIDIPSILFVLCVDLLAILLSTQLGLFLASIPATRGFKVVLFFLAFLGLCWIYGALVVGTTEALRWGVPGDLESEFWAILGVVALAILFLTGLFFCWSVALISPPSANRALIGRLFLVGMWLLLGVACLCLGLYRGPAGLDHTSLSVWTGCSVVFFCLQFLISINERDSWGPRVVRAIPRWLLLRPLAFLFYSGSAGGVFLSVICVALTLLLSWEWSVMFPITGYLTPGDTARTVFAALALYVFCYGMSAVLVRAYLLKDQIRPLFTWVVALLMLGLGTAVPWLLAFLMYSNNAFNYRGLSWWLLPNPFVGVYEVGVGYRGIGGDFPVLCFVFLLCWAGGLVCLSIPWVGRQIDRFHPPAPGLRSKAPVATGEPPMPEIAPEALAAMDGDSSPSPEIPTAIIARPGER
jgi:hypothetical protein